MAIEVREREQALRRLHRARRRLHARGRRRADGAAGAERQRQVDAAADHRRAGGARQRRASRSASEIVTDTPARTRGVGFVFQHYAPFKHMTVHDNVAFGLKRAQAPQGARSARAWASCWGWCGWMGSPSATPRSSRGGQLQRMALARALAVQPRGAAAGRALRRARRAGARRSCANGCAGCTRRST